MATSATEFDLSCKIEDEIGEGNFGKARNAILIID